MKHNYGSIIGSIIIAIAGTALSYWIANMSELPTGLGMAIMWVTAIAAATGGLSFSKPLVKLSISGFVGGLLLYLMLPVIGVIVIGIAFIVMAGIITGRGIDHLLGLVGNESFSSS